jgi:AraC family transcriptional regulator, arabinose operon regulatory protein
MPSVVLDMSNPDFKSPLTRLGTPLGNVEALGLPTIRIEECGFHPFGLDWNFDGVVSPFWRLYWNSEPGSCIIVDGVRIPLRPDTILLVPEALRFDTRGKKGVSHLWLHFTVFPHRRYGSKSPVLIRMNPQIRGCLDALMECSRKKAAIFIHYHHSHALLHAVLARFDGFWRPRLPDSLENLLDHIHANVGKELGNAVLAAFCHRSTEGFIRWFHRHMNTSPKKYLSECRVRQASRELAMTEDSIDRIAERNGFPNRNYFSRVFALTTGVPPASFRAKARNR